MHNFRKTSTTCPQKRLQLEGFIGRKEEDKEVSEVRVNDELNLVASFIFWGIIRVRVSVFLGF